MKKHGINNTTNTPIKKQDLAHSNNKPTPTFQVETENVKTIETRLKTIGYNIRQLIHRTIRLAVTRGEL